MSVAGKLFQSVAGRSIMVTGGGSGLGAATAKFFAEQGAQVTVIDLHEGEAKATAKGMGTCFVKADVCNEGDVRRALEVAQDFAGQPLFGVVNCAGICPAAKVLGKSGVHSLDIFNKAIQVNLIGTFNVCRLAVEAMSKNNSTTTMLDKEPGPTENEYHDRGVIINTASIAAYDGTIGLAAYSASKGGIVAMTLPMARELATLRIRVNTICPGIMQTPLLPESLSESLAATVPYPKRPGSPYEFASVAHFIMTNRYMNGECIRLDGATRLSDK